MTLWVRIGQTTGGGGLVISSWTHMHTTPLFCFLLAHRPLIKRLRVARNVPVPPNEMAKLRAAAKGEVAGRRGGRRRGAPSFYRDDRDWENPYAIKVSSHRQAVLPTLQQRPSQPTAAEARSLGTAMYTPPPSAAAAAGGSSEVGGGGFRAPQLGRDFKRAYKVRGYAG